MSNKVKIFEDAETKEGILEIERSIKNIDSALNSRLNNSGFHDLSSYIDEVSNLNSKKLVNGISLNNVYTIKDGKLTLKDKNPKLKAATNSIDGMRMFSNIDNLKQVSFGSIPSNPKKCFDNVESIDTINYQYGYNEKLSTVLNKVSSDFANGNYGNISNKLKNADIYFRSKSLKLKELLSLKDQDAFAFSEDKSRISALIKDVDVATIPTRYIDKNTLDKAAYEITAAIIDNADHNTECSTLIVSPYIRELSAAVMSAVQIDDLESYLKIKSIQWFSSNNKKYIVDGQTLTSLNIPVGTKQIPPRAFHKGNLIKNLTVPRSVEKIGSDAFGRTGITRAYFDGFLPSSISSMQNYPWGLNLSSIFLDTEIDFLDTTKKAIKEFHEGSFDISAVRENKESVKKILLSRNLSSVSSNAFQGMEHLTNVEVPIEITEIGENAFYGLPQLQEVLFKNRSYNDLTAMAGYPWGLESWQINEEIKTSRIDYNNGTQVYLEDKALTLAKMNHSETETSSDISAVRIGTNVDSIEDGFVAKLSSASFSIPLNNETFKNRNGLVTQQHFNYEGNAVIDRILGVANRNVLAITMPDGNYTLDENAFKNLHNLRKVSEGRNYRFNDNEFSGCENIQDLSVYGEKRIDEVCYDSKNSIKTVKILGTSIAPSAFIDCENLQAVVLPEDKVLSGNGSFFNSIGDSAFKNCTNLTSVSDIPFIKFWTYLGYDTDAQLSIDTRFSIGNSAFEGCSKLSSITLPDTYKWIGDRAFCDCTSLSVLFDNDKYIRAEQRSEIYTEIAANFINKFSKDSWLFKTSPRIDRFGRDVFKNCANIEINGVNYPYSYSDDKWKQIKSGWLGYDLDRDNSFGNNMLNSFFTTVGRFIPDKRPIKYRTDGGNPYIYYYFDYGYGVSKDYNEIWIAPGVDSLEGELQLRDLFYLTNLHLPSSLKKIGRNGIYNTGLSELYIHDGLKEIGENGIVRNRSLQRVRIPASTDTIHQRAFYETNQNNAPTKYWFAERYFDEIEALPNYPFGANTSRFIAGKKETTFLLADGTIEYRKIEGEMTSGDVQDLTNIVELSVGSEVSAIGAGAFKNNSSLSAVSFLSAERFYYWENGRCISRIENEAFMNCTNLKTFNAVDEIEFIGESAFEGCENLSSFTPILMDESSIQPRTFKNCRNLIIDSNTLKYSNLNSVGEEAFMNCSCLKNSFLNNRRINSIGRKAFFNCDGITDISDLWGGNSIGESAFGNCHNISSIYFYDNQLINMGANAFSNCSSLKTVSTPIKDEGFGENAFSGCNALTSFNIRNMMQLEVDTLPYYPWGIEDTSIIRGTATKNWPSSPNSILRYIDGHGERVVLSSTLSAMVDSNLSSIIIGHNVSTILENAFAEVPSLTEAYLSVVRIEPDEQRPIYTPIKIGPSAFNNGNPNLSVFFYGYTKSDLSVVINNYPWGLDPDTQVFVG